MDGAQTFTFAPIGHIESCFRRLRGIPRQGALAPATKARLVLQSSVRDWSVGRCSRARRREVCLGALLMVVSVVFSALSYCSESCSAKDVRHVVTMQLHSFWQVQACTADELERFSHLWVVFVFHDNS